MDTTVNVEDKAEEPKVGMLFNSVEELRECYTRYATELGFSIFTRQTIKGYDGERIYVRYSCTRSGKLKSSAMYNACTRSGKVKSTSRKTNCDAKISASVQPNGRWKVTSVVYDHNHELNPGETRFYNRIKCDDDRSGEAEARLCGGVSCDEDWSGKTEARRFDDMCNAFFEVADLSTDSEDKTKKVLDWINKLKNELKRDEGICGSSQPATTVSGGTSTSGGDVIPISKESGNILAPIAVRSKEQPPSKRKQSKDSEIQYHGMHIGGSNAGHNVNLGVPQSGSPILPRGGSFAPPMQAYGCGYGMSNPTHPMFSQPPMIPYWTGHGSGMASNANGKLGNNDTTQPSIGIQPPGGNLEGDGRPRKGRPRKGEPKKAILDMN